MHVSEGKKIHAKIKNVAHARGDRSERNSLDASPGLLRAPSPLLVSLYHNRDVLSLREGCRSKDGDKSKIFAYPM